jgi:large subunit ribosomal protein L5
MPLGAHVTLTGGEMWVWLDRLKETVLPRIREWKGVDPLAVSNGAVSIILPDSVVGYFSDIEPHFDMFPKLFGMHGLTYGVRYTG